MKSSQLIALLVVLMWYSSNGNALTWNASTLEAEACPEFLKTYMSWTPPKYHWSCIQSIGSCETKENYAASCQVSQLEEAYVTFDVHYDRLLTGYAGLVRDNEEFTVQCLINASTYGWDCSYLYLYMDTGLSNGGDLQNYQIDVLGSFRRSVQTIEDNLALYK